MARVLSWISTGVRFNTSPTSHSSPSHEFQHEPVPGVHGPKDDFINSFLVDNVPLNSLGTFEYLPDNRSVAGVGEGRKLCINDEIVERCEY